jgi:hypothetical protein
VFWWYILPPGAAIAVIYSSVTWQCRGLWKAPVDVWGALFVSMLWTITAVVFYGVYRLNQYWVQKEGLPRRQELKDLVDNLKSLENSE